MEAPFSFVPEALEAPPSFVSEAEVEQQNNSSNTLGYYFFLAVPVIKVLGLNRGIWFLAVPVLEPNSGIRFFSVLLSEPNSGIRFLHVPVLGIFFSFFLLIVICKY